MDSPVTSPIDSPAAWRADELDGPHAWSVVLDEHHVRELDAALSHARGSGRTLLHVEREDFPLDAVKPVLDDVLARMVRGPGFVCLRGLPVQRWGEESARLALWGLGKHLGWAEPQDGAGSLMHDVRDEGRSFGADDSIRYFQTRQSIDFHNDGADVFALLCLRKGQSGGMSRIVSAVEVFNQIARRRPDLARVLQQDFHVDARGQRTDGEACQVLPIYAFQAGFVGINLKLAYIRSAQRFDSVPPLTAAQEEALDMLVAVMEEPGMALELELEPGEALIASNHVVLHGRTAFSDASSGGQRHMLRLWLTIAHGPPLPPHYADTREFGATYARRIGGA